MAAAERFGDAPLSVRARLSRRPHAGLTAQWSTTVGSTKGIYVLFNGRNMSSPLVRGVKAIRLTGINGATAFRIGMLNLTAH